METTYIVELFLEKNNNKKTKTNCHLNLMYFKNKNALAVMTSHINF